ncbi:MAG: beta-galactosidase [Blautia sp.]
MRIFRDARINSATINVFSWAKIQPSEEKYDFSELDESCQDAERGGLRYCSCYFHRSCSCMDGKKISGGRTYGF